MAWNPPSTFSTGTILTAAQLNQIRESLLYLHGDAGPISLANALQSAVLLDPTGTARMKLWTSTGKIGTTPQVIIADGAADVTEFAVASGAFWDGTSNIPIGLTHGAAVKVGQTLPMTLGTNTLNLRVQANGALDVFMTNPTPDYYAILTVMWR
jgi:hypothetical protein